MHPDSTKYFAFRTPWGDFEHLTLPQGWCNSPAYFQKLMTWVLRQYWNTCAIAFMDDIPVFSPNTQTHYIHVRQVTKTLQNAGFVISRSKSIYHQKQITLLGYLVSSGGFRPQMNFQAIAEWPIPATKLHVQQWVGTINHMRNHIPNLAKLASPLYDALGATFTMGAIQVKSFHETKHAALRALTLHTHTPGCNQHMILDASLTGLGVILEEKGKPIAVVSRCLSAAEQNYDTTERELLAVVWGLERLYHFTAGTPSITVHTDHANLVTTLKPSLTVRRRNRWIEWLSRFHLTWQHIPGAENPADGVSRLYEKRKN